MSKIKDILEKVRSEKNTYTDLSLRLAKRTWLLVAAFYYLSVLFTVGGFYFGPVNIHTLSLIAFHLYSVLVITSVWFLYSLAEYGVVIYAPDRRYLLHTSLGLVILFACVTLVAHLGFFS